MLWHIQLEPKAGCNKIFVSSVLNTKKRMYCNYRIFTFLVTGSNVPFLYDYISVDNHYYIVITIFGSTCTILIMVANHIRICLNVLHYNRLYVLLSVLVINTTTK